MADIESNINVRINAAEALSTIKALQKEISVFHSEMSKMGAASAVTSSQMQSKLVASLNATGNWSAQMTNVASTTNAFNTSLEKNKLSMGEYFRYAGASTQTFGKLFKSEFETINKVARESVKDLQTQYIKLGRDANGTMQSISVRPTMLDMKSLETQTAMSAARFQTFNKLVDQGSTNLLNLGKNTQWAGRQLMVGFTLPLAIFGAAAASAFLDIEKAAVQFKRVYGDAMTPLAETNAMTQQIKDLAGAYTQYGVSISSTMNMAASAAAMGKTGKDLTGQVDQTAKLSVLGGIDQQKSLETITSLTNTFGIATKDLAGNIDFLNAIENQTVLSIDDMTTAIPIAAPVVAQLGGNVRDLTVMLTAMKEGGINASEGANALKSGLASLINPTQSAVNALGAMGVNLTAIRDSNQGNAAGMISSLAAELDKLDPLAKAQAIEQLFGKFQFARMSTLLENINKQGGQAAQALKLTKASAEELAALSSKELGTIAASPAFKFQKAIEDLKASLAPIGEAFIKLVTPIMNWGISILNMFNSLSDGGKTFVLYAVGILGAVVPVALMLAGLLGNGLANLIKFGMRLFGFGMGIKNLASGTKMLGDGTVFMSQTQRDAASAASSLDQVHQQLVQRFSSEREAVDLLVKAYQNAIVAQGLLRGAPATSDLPGNRGAVAAGAGVSSSREERSGSGGRVGKPVSTVSRPYTENVSAGKSGLVQFGDISPNNTADVANLYAGRILKQANITASSVEEEVSSWAITNKKAISAATSAVNSGIPAAEAYSELMKKFDSDMVSSGGAFNRYAIAADRMMPELQRDLTSTQAEARRLNLNVKGAADATELARQMPGSLIARDLSTPGNYQSLAKHRQGLSSVLGGVGAIEEQGIPRFMTDALPADRAYKLASSQEHFSATKESEASLRNHRGENAQRAGLETGTSVISAQLIQESKDDLEAKKQVTAEAENEAKTARAENNKRQAIYKELEKVNSGELSYGKIKTENLLVRVENAKAEDLRLGALSAARIQIGEDSVRVASANLQLESSAGNDRRIVQRRLALYSAEEQVLNGELAYNGNRNASVVKARIIDDQIIAAREASALAAKETAAADLKSVQAAEQRALSEKEAALSTDQKAEADKKSAQSAKVQAEENASTAKAARSERLRRVGGVASGVGMAAGMVSMGISSMGGPIGDAVAPIAGVVTTISTMGMALSMIPGPAGLVVAGLIALVAGVSAVIGAIDDAKKQGQEIASAMSATAEKINGFGAASGATSISSQQKATQDAKIASLGAKTPEQIALGTTYIGTDAGKAFLKDIETQVSSGSDMASIAKNVSSQLATGVAEGVLNKDQADSIATALGQSLKNAKFAIDIQGNLSSLLGPNGENLLNNPSGVTMGLAKENSGQADAASGIYNGKKEEINNQKNIRNGVGVAFMGIGAAAAGLLGAGAATAATGIGAPVGIAFIIAGAAVATASWAISTAEVAKQSAIVVGLYSEAYQQDIALVAVLGAQYDKTIATKKAQADAAKTEGERKRILQEIVILENDRASAIGRQNAATAELVQQAKDAKYGKNGQGGMGVDTWNDAQKGQIGITYKDNSVGKEQALSAYEKTNQITDQTAQVSLQLQISSGALSPTTADNILTAMTDPNHPTMQQEYTALLTSAGDQKTIDLMSSLGALGADQNTLAKFVNLTATATDPGAEVTRIMDLMDISNNLKSFNINIDINTAEGQSQLDKIQKSLKDYNQWFADGKNSQEVFTYFHSLGFNMTQQQMDYYNSLPASQQKVYTTAYLKVSESINTNSVEGQQRLRDWSKGKQKNYSVTENGKATLNYGAIATDMVDESTRSMVAKAPIEPPAPVSDTSNPVGGGGGGGAAASSMLDSLTAKLRQVQMASAAVTAGWAASRTALDNIFPGGAGSSPFNGLEQQMRRLGAKEDLITMIAGMDPAEFEKRKNELFTFDGAGNIIGFRESLLSIGSAMRSIAFGTFQSKQQSTIAMVNDQIVATRKLVAIGYTYAQALEITKDANLASAISQEANSDTLKALTADTIAATTAQKNLAAAQGLAAVTQTAVDKAALAAKLARDESSGAITKTQAAAVLADANAQQLYMNPNFDPATLQAALDTAANSAALDLKIKKLTIDGLESIFQDGFNKAMEAFSAQQKAIEIKFAVNEDPLKAIIKNAQQAIQDINQKPGGLNDLNADLQRISDKEKIINDRYAVRQKALDSIKQMNAAIVNQNKAQLTIADALTQGDISGAAKAIQDARAQAATDYAQSQQQLMDASKQTEIDALTASYGMTRKQLEASILDLKTQVFNIEQATIAPAQYRLDLLERTKNSQIESLTVLGKTKAQWEAIKNRIDVAKTSSDLYTKAMNEALSVVKDILTYWTEAEKPKATTYTITTVHVDTYVSGNIGASGDGGNGGGGSGSPENPSPSPSPETLPDTTVSGFASRYAQAWYHTSRTSPENIALVKAYVAYKAFMGPMTSSTPVFGNLNNQLISMGYNTGGLVDGIGNTDKISAMLTPGEFVITKPAVAAFGASNLANINNGKSMDSSVYNNNYSVVVNAKSDSNPQQIANAVMDQIKQVNNQRIRGNSF